MALAREQPKCTKCGKMIAGIYGRVDLVGDGFIKWDYEGHKCTSFTKFASDNDMTYEEMESCFKFLKALRIMPHVDELRRLLIIVKSF